MVNIWCNWFRHSRHINFNSQLRTNSVTLFFPFWCSSLLALCCIFVAIRLANNQQMARFGSRSKMVLAPWENLANAPAEKPKMLLNGTANGQHEPEVPSSAGALSWSQLRHSALPSDLMFTQHVVHVFLYAANCMPGSVHLWVDILQRARLL